MQKIRIPEEHWERVWWALVKSGPITRIDVEPIYLIDDEQLKLLRRKKLPFELLPLQNGQPRKNKHG